MRKKNRMRNSQKKERTIMFAASLFVLSALTLTGVYVKEMNTNTKDDGYTIDLNTLDNKKDTGDQALAKKEEEPDNSLSVQNPKAEYELDLEAVLDTEDAGEMNVAQSEAPVSEEEKKDEKDQSKKEPENEPATENAEATEQNEEKEENSSVSASTWEALRFTENDNLVWPTAGEILINYSMDKTVYFPTLAQYKYNPALIIGAAQGKTIVAAANAQVKELFYDSEIGNAVRMDLGNGYELVYGQLADIKVSKGSYVKAGDAIGAVAAPTKYYSVEGSNLYVKMTKDGEPINPLTMLP